MGDGFGRDERAVVAPRLQLRLLGAFRLECEGRRLSLPAGPQRLVAYLGLRGVEARAAVAGTLWPDVPEARALACLRSTLWRIHQLDLPLVVAADGLLELHRSVDVDVRQLGPRAERGHPADAATVLALRTGDLLPDWDDEWLLIERERVRQLRLHALEAAADRLRVERRFAEALDVALQCVRIEPLRESAHRAVLAIHLAEGNVCEAVRHLRAFELLLRAELGARPSQSLVRLVYGSPQVAGRHDAGHRGRGPS